jgi:hypothetical protein
MTVRGSVGRTTLVCLVVAALAMTAIGRPPVPAPTPLVQPAVVTNGPCRGALTSESQAGVLTIEGGPLGSTAASGVTINYSYFLEVQFVARGTTTALTTICLSQAGNVTTGPSGAFDFSLVVPATDCSLHPGICIEYTGPYVPVSVRPSGPPPVGYSTSISGAAADFAIAFVYDLASVHLSPAGPTLTVAPGAPTTFVAEGLMANGSVTPLDVTFAWSLSGTGWSFDPTPSGSTATVVAVPGASVGTLGVGATATVPDAVLTSPPAALTLLQQPTAIEDALIDRTTADVGSTLTARLWGVGAVGYPYSASVDPGLGLGPVVASCVASASGPGTTTVNCTANITYPSPGIAQPTAVLTNGFSASEWQFPDVTIDPTPLLSVEPGIPIGYASSPLPIELVAANGSGAPPYSGACLGLPSVPVTCQGPPGPTWDFRPTFPAPGRYSALAWAIDADGVNASLAFSITVVPSLTLGTIATVSENLTAGTATVLTASISGGDLPVRYWWNASDIAGSLLAGSSDADGPISVAFVPPAAAAVTVSLTAIDALGTFVEIDRLFAVGPEEAITLTAVDAPPAAPVVAGSPFAIAWEAFDRSEDAVRTFGAAGEVSLSDAGTAPTGWVNASGLGPLPSLGNGSFGVPATAWVGGILNLSITTTTAGVLSVSLTGPALPGPPGALIVVISPDRSHVRFFDPVVVTPGIRTNSTFWHVTDRFGNAATGAVVTLRTTWGAVSYTTLAAAITGPNGTAGVWVNYSVPGTEGGELTVLDASGAILLGPIAISPITPPPPVSAAAVTFAAAVPIGALGATLSGFVRRRARSRAVRRSDEEELRRLAEGRSQVVELVRRSGTADLSALEEAWRPAPAPPDLSEWLASLVADGTLGATVGQDGRARFCLAVGRPSGPRVTIDPDVFDRAQDRRREMLDGDET